MRYWKECESCKDDMQKALCVYCEKPLVECSDLGQKLAALESLASDVLAILETMPQREDTRPARYSVLNDKLIATQVLAHVRMLADNHK